MDLCGSRSCNLVFISMLLLLLTGICLVFHTEPNAFAPELDLKNYDGDKIDVYRGFIISDERVVSIVPELKATDKDEIGGAST